MNNIIHAENAAVAAIEKIFEQAGWSDGWGLTDDEVRNAPSPLFYRNATSQVAEEARPVMNGQAQSLYCIYNIAPTDPKYSGNRPYGFEVTICLTFYYSDPFLFHEESEANPFICSLMHELTEKLWIITGEGEQPVPPTENRQAYTNRKLIFVTNYF